DRDTIGGLGGLSQDVVEAVTPFAGQARDNALHILQAVFSKAGEVTNLTVGATTGLDVETTLVGDFFLFEVNLQTEAAEVFPCLTFIHRDVLAPAVEREVPAGPTG